MGLATSKLPPREAVPAGKIRVCVAGFGLSHHTGRARAIAEEVVKTQPCLFESWFYFNSSGFRGEGGLLPLVKSELPTAQRGKFKAHKSSPFCWLEHPDGSREAIGGRDDLCDWVTSGSG